MGTALSQDLRGEQNLSAAHMQNTRAQMSFSSPSPLKLKSLPQSSNHCQAGTTTFLEITHGAHAHSLPDTHTHTQTLMCTHTHTHRNTDTLHTHSLKQQKQKGTHALQRQLLASTHLTADLRDA
eukprot:1157216-Pelagomonas_calceolata.AAC.3